MKFMDRMMEAFTTPRYVVKFNSAGRRGYEVVQCTFESREEAERWIERATGPKSNYKIVRSL